MSDAAEDLEDMIERGHDTPWDRTSKQLRRFKMCACRHGGQLHEQGSRCKALNCGCPKFTSDPVAGWVARLNRLARELDETADALHPSAWPEELKAQLERYRKEATKCPEK